MKLFSFLLADEAAAAPQEGTFPWALVIFAAVIVVFFIFSWRNNKKRTKAENDMRDNLRVGDEITTIGGIVGKIVSLRDETMVIETSKDKTHIRLLRAALRSVDVKAEDSVDPHKVNAGKNNTNGNKKPSAVEPAEMKDATEEPVVEETTEPKKKGKKKSKTTPPTAEAPAVEVETTPVEGAAPAEAEAATEETAPAVETESTTEA